jgi:hypothetical protein
MSSTMKAACAVTPIILVAVIGFIFPRVWFWISWELSGAVLVAVGCIGEWMLLYKKEEEGADHRRLEKTFAIVVAIGVTMDAIGLGHAIPEALQLSRDVSKANEAASSNEVQVVALKLQLAEISNNVVTNAPANLTLFAARAVITLRYAGPINGVHWGAVNPFSDNPRPVLHLTAGNPLSPSPDLFVTMVPTGPSTFFLPSGVFDRGLDLMGQITWESRADFEWKPDPEENRLLIASKSSAKQLADKINIFHLFGINPLSTNFTFNGGNIAVFFNHAELLDITIPKQSPKGAEIRGYKKVDNRGTIYWSTNLFGR